MQIIKRLLSSGANVQSLIDTYSKFSPSPVSLARLTEFGKHISNQDSKLSKNEQLHLVNQTEIKSFEFLREELLVRLASMMKEMHYLPQKLMDTSSVKTVQSWYLKSFIDIVEYREIKKINEKVLSNFTKTLNNIVNRHSDVVPTMSLGILQLQETYGIDVKTEQSIQYFLDRFLMSRISIRMLINQHVLMFGEEQEITQPGRIGAIHTNCDVTQVVQDAYTNAKFLCEQYYLCAPKVKYVFKNLVEKDKDIKLVYVPSHLYHMAFELYKNSMRALIEHYGQDAKEYPAIETLIVKGHDNLTIRLTDYGGGIPFEKLPYLFKYMYSTAPRPSIDSSVYNTSTSAPLAGFGYGLPLSRLYARYFNGDLTLSSIDGHCTDANIHLKILSSEANESLPIYNRTTVNNYKFNQNIDPSNDWTDNKRNYSS